MKKWTKSNLITEVNRFISKTAELWHRGYPTNETKRSYKFEELKDLTDGNLEIKTDLNGRSTVFLYGKYIGSLDIIYEGDYPIEADMHVVFNSSHQLADGFVVPTEVMASLYYILLELLKENVERAKYKFEKLGFDGFYER